MKLRYVAGLCLVMLVFAAPSAWADIVGSVYQVQGNYLPAGDYSGSGLLEGTFTAPGINFIVPEAQGTSNPLKEFLNSGGASYGAMGGLNDVMSNCPVNGPTADSTCYSTAITITGSQFFTDGASYSLTHDDGVMMLIAGNLFINAATPVSETTSSAVFGNPSGVYNYTIYYMATNGNPEVLKSASVGVPDGGTTVMLLGLALGIGRLVSRRLT